MKFKDEVLQMHPSWGAAQKIILKLKENNFEAVLAGGCVRDGFLGRIPKDLDIATSAEPNQVEKLFTKTVAVGKAFGVICVIDEQSDIEVASFRFDGGYEDGRRPVAVKWATATEDALRRDFTINALFYDPIEKKLTDHVGGVQDIESKSIRCVGDSRLRFQEDHLRLLRAVRFMAELNFNIEEKTWQSIIKHASLIKTVSRERIRDEVLKILKSKNEQLGFEKLYESGLLAGIDSELNLMILQKKQYPRILSQSLYDEQIWTQYFQLIQPTKLESQIDLYKLSKDQKKYIQKTLRCISLADQIPNWTLGKKLFSYQDAEFKFALQLLSQKKQPQWVSQLMDEVKSRGLNQGFPAPIVRGQDVPAEIPMADRGCFIDSAYEYQLESQSKDKTQIINAAKVIATR